MKLVPALLFATLSLLSAALSAAVFGAPLPRGDWPATRARAEGLYAQGSFELARRAYLEVDANTLAPEDRRWLEFRLADTRWRAAAGAERVDDTEFVEARRALEDLQRRVDRREERDRTWALVEESLGDWGWARRGARDSGFSFPHYQAALEWWSGARDVEAARRAYLDIAFRMGWPEDEGGDEMWWFGSVPRPVAENAVKIAVDPRDRARAQLLLASVLRRQGGDYDAQARMFEALRAVVAMDRGTRGRDLALYRLAQWIESNGEPKVADDGSWKATPDYVEALGLYQRLTEEYPKGSSSQWDESRAGAARILRTEVGVALPSAFLPGSRVGYTLSWRNAARVDLALHPVDLTRDVPAPDARHSVSEWLQRMDLTRIEPVQRWTHDTKDDGRHVPGSAELVLEGTLAPGAYVLEARAGAASARDLVLVSSASLVVKAVGESVLAWCVDGETSVPIPDATVRVLGRTYDADAWRPHEATARTGADGTATFTTPRGSNREILVAARAGDRTAFAFANTWSRGVAGQRWRLYATTDRSAYRPGDEVNWKLVARRTDGGAWTTPAGETVAWEITDPRGASFAKGRSKLSEFGSAFGVLRPPADAPLGEYRVSFTHADLGIGGATLFRVEEYKLPEYEVRVRPLDDDGRPRRFVVGDKVEVEVTASFYSGGPVGGADVEVVVEERPFTRSWQRPRDFPWLYAPEDDARWSRWNRGRVVKQEKVATDARGVARVTFDTPRDLGNDYEYTIQARVTDASRREVSGEGRVRVTRREYDVHVELPRNLQTPGRAAEVKLEARDANDAAVVAAGAVRVTRERWVEAWLDPKGRVHEGDELADLRLRWAQFPPPPAPGERPWRRVKGEYQGDEVTRATLVLGTDGRGTFSFVPPREGYYKITWTSRDARGRPVAAEAWTWAVDDATRGTGYVVDGVDLVLDQDTIAPGAKAPVLVTTALSNRWVLVCVEGEALHAHQVVHVEGTARLVPLDVTEALIPNAWITATTVQDGDVQRVAREIVVPPLEQFLDVSVTSDRDPVTPGSKATLTVTTKDHRGAPVAVEVALALVDESVAAIGGDYAADVRAFFHGERRDHDVTTATSSDGRRSVRYVLRADGTLVDDRFAYEPAAIEGESTGVLAVGLGGGGGRGAGAAKARRNLGAMPAPGRPAGTTGAPAPTMEMSDRFMDSSSLAGLSFGAHDAKDDDGATGSDGQYGGSVEVRSDFRETAFWSPDLRTGADGVARVEVAFPDSLTRWKATARAVDRGTKVGNGASTVRASKPLVARLQAPRFFTVGDETFVSGVVGNRTDVEVRARAEIALEGGLELVDPRPSEVVVPPQGDVRVDWKVRAVRAGDVRVTFTARGARDGDAMARTYPVQDRGVEVQVARTLRLTDAELVATLDVPAERNRDTTRFTVDVTPSIAVTMLDALPYLIEYPYGCTEQTMSRFLPAAIVAHTLRARGLSPEDALRRAFGGIEPETAGVTHPGRAKALDQLDRVTRQSLERLVDFQHADGGWGWWKDGDSDPWMSAYVVWGLALARDAGLDVKASVLERGRDYLALALVEAESDPDLAAWMLNAAAASGLPESEPHARTAFTKLWERKNDLRAYGRALFALAAHGFGRAAEARELCANLVNGVEEDAHPDASRIGAAGQPAHAAALATAHWGSSGSWWRWRDGPVESTAFALRALATIDPKNPLVSRAANWLVQNRRGAQWSSTRDTAIAILGLDAFLDATGEVAREVEYELLVNGTVVARRALTPADMLAAPARVVVPPEAVRDGANEVRLRRVRGDGPLYLAARSVFFSREPRIPARGSDLFVRRQYYRLAPRPTLLAGVVYDRVPLADAASVTSGERVEVVLTLEAKNDFEYLMFEDLKPAGLEAADVRSGGPAWASGLKAGEIDRRFEGGRARVDAPDEDDPARFTGRRRFVHQELRDRKVALFLDRLPQGVWEVRYELRAEVPGRFTALPTLGEAMYAPEIRANGDDQIVVVEDRGTKGQ